VHFVRTARCRNKFYKLNLPTVTSPHTHTNAHTQPLPALATYTSLSVLPSNDCHLLAGICIALDWLTWGKALQFRRYHSNLSGCLPSFIHGHRQQSEQTLIFLLQSLRQMSLRRF